MALPTRPESALRRRAVAAPTLWCAVLLAVFLLSLALPPANLFATPGSYLPVHLSLEFVALAVSIMVYALAWNLRDSESNAQVMLLGWASLVVTLVGVAQALDGDNVESLLSRADGALYEAKRAGRNRVHRA